VAEGGSAGHEAQEEEVSGQPREWRRPHVELLDRDPLEVAPWLLNKLLVHGETAGRIVEVEAYRGADDPASHAFAGPRPRNATMFGPPGHLYVYFTYGMHHCANVVCLGPGVAGAVLLRALAPERGLEAMQTRRRRARRTHELCNGPAKLCQALGLDRTVDGADLLHGGSPALVDDGTPPPPEVAWGPRIGISRAQDYPWRCWIPAHPCLSAPAGMVPAVLAAPDEGRREGGG
jgi:DNA-3-methyladenine glycosylase